MPEPGQREFGVDPEEFGSARVDAAALLDAELGDVDWSVPPPGSAQFTLEVPSGKLAAMALGNPVIRASSWCRVPQVRRRIFPL